jgi:hypothetical protein
MRMPRMDSLSRSAADVSTGSAVHKRANAQLLQVTFVASISWCACGISVSQLVSGARALSSWIVVSMLSSVHEYSGHRHVSARLQMTESSAHHASVMPT